MTEQLVERIEFISKSGSRANNGEITYATSSIATVWAKPIPKSGDEDTTGNKKKRVQKVDWVIRHREDIDTADRLVWDGRTWDIKSINPYFKKGRRNYKYIESEFTEGQF
ncbi:phage head closure protein [Aliifodinibius sp. S!AR15-10]|uniref:phage head closure protein n=1 Tax=Aliifodinibius sp. S!AR15-10 TaxID=2950437 RepID=UPI00285AA89F|nr:phage head closure protein [Aliifodinibius sp. S!AR15-10]MDR8390993.1 phage head closure protein [Aliifodinibius sp. S!AR15-10]